MKTTKDIPQTGANNVIWSFASDKSNSLRQPDLPFGFNGRELSSFLVLSTPSHLWAGVSQWLPCLRLCWGQWSVHGSLFSLMAVRDEVCWAHGSFWGAFWEPPSGHVACKEAKIIHMGGELLTAAPWKAVRRLSQGKGQRGYLRMGCTWAF